MASLRYQATSDGGRLAFHHTEGAGPGVLFCSGFNSTMQGTKATFLESFCRQQGWQYTRFDYRGHGESSGEFSHCDISQWRDDALNILDNVCAGPQIVVGSSMGGWIATLLAQARTNRVAGLMTIAAAPDFTEELIWHALTPDEQQALSEGELWQMPNHYDDGEPYAVRMSLILSGRAHLLLDKSIGIDCPVRLLHGTADVEVPWSLSSRLLDKLCSTDARLTLVKAADHRFSAPEQLTLITNTLSELHTLVS
ncbi:MAG: alpha/beta hydrolase [Granulosicoccus sp.]|nr:alpha/beta hydrolase [Granulosicoccus sp.]